MQIIVAAGVMLLAVLGVILWGLPRAASAYAASKQGPDAKILAAFEALRKRFDELTALVERSSDEIEEQARRAENAAKRSAYHAGRVVEEREGWGEEAEPPSRPRGDEAGGGAEEVPAVHQAVGESPDIAQLRRQIAFQ